MNDIQKNIVEILSTKIETDRPIADFGLNENLNDLGINSMSFIKLIVEIEEAFDIEFLNEELDFTYLNTIENISQYISEKI